MTATPTQQGNLRLMMPHSVYEMDSTSTYASYRQDYDLTTPSLKVTKINRSNRKEVQLTASISEIPANFMGFRSQNSNTANNSTTTTPGTLPNRTNSITSFDPVDSKNSKSQEQSLYFVLDHCLNILGVDVDSSATKINCDEIKRSVSVEVSLVALNPLGILTLDYISEGSFVGTVFCRRERRAIHDIDYIRRLKDVQGVRGHPVIYSAPAQAADGKPWYEWKMELIDGRIIMWVPLEKGAIRFGGEIHSLLPTVGMSLQKCGADVHGSSINNAMINHIALHEKFMNGASRLCVPNESLIVRTVPFQFDCLYARIVQSLLPEGVVCGSHSVLDPTSMDNIDALHSGAASNNHRRTFVFSGHSSQELTHVPIEFFSLEAFREQVPVTLRRRLLPRANNVDDLHRAFATAPSQMIDGLDCQASVFICKGGLFDRIKEHDWVSRYPTKQEDHRLINDPAAKLGQVTQYLHQQCEYPILSAINIGDITSEGILLTKYFPSPVIKSLLLSRAVVKKVRAVIFSKVSRSFGFFLSEEDRHLLVDLDSFGISVYFYNDERKILYQYTRRVNIDQGMFVPVDRREEYLNATFFGVYGSNLVEGDFESELETFLKGLLELSKTCTHPLLNKNKSYALCSGGGPGAMEVGNRVAKKLGMLSCGMVVDFGSLHRKPGVTINEQKQNPYVEAFMTYRPEKLVERQADFHLDFPLFLQGGVGTDFEYALEEVRRKVGTAPPHPMILFGDTWPSKIQNRFKSNLGAGTIKGSEWLSNIPYIVNSGKQALAVMTRFFNGTLECGPGKKTNQDGYVLVDDSF